METWANYVRVLNCWSLNHCEGQEIVALKMVRG
jgi:hypothetical protein